MVHTPLSDAQRAQALAALMRPRTYVDRLCDEMEGSTARFEEAESLTRTAVEYFALPVRFLATPITALFRR
ncbi:hypothetical protein [Azospirillum sp. sgz302134]